MEKRIRYYVAEAAEFELKTQGRDLPVEVPDLRSKPYRELADVLPALPKKINWDSDYGSGCALKNIYDAFKIEFKPETYKVARVKSQ